MKSGDIAFKVVHKEDRRSCSFHHHAPGDWKDEGDEQFVRYYLKDHLIVADKASLGLFVFSKLRYAELFRLGEMSGFSYMTLRVKVRGRTDAIKRIGFIPTRASRGRLYQVNKRIWSKQLSFGDSYGLHLKVSKGQFRFISLRSVPQGTFCVPAVKVLE